METIYEKQDDTTLRVVKPVATTEEKTYNLDFLKEQELQLLKSKNEFIQARDKELEEVRSLIAQCETLGIKTKVEVELASEKVLEADLIQPLIK